ncbi:MAG: hypothetical protein ACI360_03460 [Atopobiaceae bacterium]
MARPKGSHFSTNAGRRATASDRSYAQGSDAPRSGVPNTTDPFSPDYVDPATSKRDLRREQKRAERQARKAQQGGNGLWNLVYVLAALIVTLLVWFLFNGGI